MDFIFQLLCRSLAGLCVMVPGIVVYFLILNKKGSRQSVGQFLLVIIFSYLLIGMLTVTGISSITYFEPRVNLTPLVDIIPDFIQSLLNVVLFVPFGFLVPALYRKYNKCRCTLLTGFIFSLAIEIIQMFGFGATDINDLITNTFGAFLGYMLWKTVELILKKNVNLYRKSEELWGLIIYAWIVMLTVQPYIVEHILKLE